MIVTRVQTFTKGTQVISLQPMGPKLQTESFHKKLVVENEYEEENHICKCMIHFYNETNWPSKKYNVLTSYLSKFIVERLIDNIITYQLSRKAECHITTS